MDRRTFVFTASIALLIGSCFTSASAQDPDTTVMARKLLSNAHPLGERSMGSPGAPVVIIEYASATCPHCAEFHNTIWPLIRSKYVDTGKVRFIFREFPLDNLAFGAFILARCAPEDQYFPTIDLLFKHQDAWMSSTVRKELFRIMQMVGMDKVKFDECLNRDDLGRGIVEGAQTARDEFGVKATPTFFINGGYVRGVEGFAPFEERIEAELKKVKSAN
jgi:protein-disulfide isomerase